MTDVVDETEAQIDRGRPAVTTPTPAVAAEQRRRAGGINVGSRR
ncbi:MAG: hypothetical protein ACRCZD_07765 [Phycicoccus sp.]